MQGVDAASTVGPTVEEQSALQILSTSGATDLKAIVLPIAADLAAESRLQRDNQRMTAEPAGQLPPIEPANAPTLRAAAAEHVILGEIGEGARKELTCGRGRGRCGLGRTNSGGDSPGLRRAIVKRSLRWRSKTSGKHFIASRHAAWLRRTSGERESVASSSVSSSFQASTRKLSSGVDGMGALATNSFLFCSGSTQSQAAAEEGGTETWERRSAAVASALRLLNTRPKASRSSRLYSLPIGHSMALLSGWHRLRRRRRRGLLLDVENIDIVGVVSPYQH